MGQGTQTTTTQNSPFPGVVPLLNTAFKDARRLYQQGGNPTYMGSTVTPYSLQTMQGYRGMMDAANRNTGGKGLSRQYQNIINNGGFTGEQRQALNGMRRQQQNLGADGLTNIQDRAYDQLRSMQGQLGSNGLTRTQDNALGSLNQLQNRLGANGMTNAQDRIDARFQNLLRGLGDNGLSNTQDQALQNYQQTANASYSTSANPGFENVLKQAQTAASDAANLNAAAAGRYGSGTHEGVLAREVGNLTGRMVNDDYNRFLGRQDNANAAMANLGQQGLGNIQGIGNNILQNSQAGLSNLQSLAAARSNMAQQGFGNNLTLNNNASALGQQGYNNLSQGNQNIFNAGQAGIGNMGAAYAGMQAPFNTMLQVGGAQEDLQRRLMADRLRIFDGTVNAPWTNLTRLMSIAGGGQPYSTQTQTAPGPNPFLSTLGGVSSGISLLNGLL